MAEAVLRLFVSSPGDVPDERRRVDLVVERLNAEFAGRARIETIRWETGFYSAHDTFQRQIPEAADCDVVVAVFRARLGTQLPAGFPRLPSGEPYPSGTAYEVLSAIEARRRGNALPDIFVFRYPSAPSVPLDAPDRAEIEAQWARLKGFFDTWFRAADGTFVAAFQSYASTDDFAEKAEACLRQWLARRGFVARGAAWDRALGGSPFPGLAAFEADHGSVFFGRDLAVAQSIARLREAGAEAGRAPFLLVIGASGSGKSSLLRAGLLPRLVLPGTIPEIDLWRTAIAAPGPDPFLTLAEGLLADAALGPELRRGAFATKALLGKQLAGDVETAVAALRAALDAAAEERRHAAHFEAPRPARLALAIDQAERLFVEVDATTAAAFAALLGGLVRQNLAYVIFALRSDAYARFQGIEALVALREAGATFDLVPPAAAELEEIVTRPVAACHPSLAFEQRDGRSLAARLVADAKGGDALPLLQMTLSRLYAAEAARGDGLLRFADYRGMDAAVTETANEALETLDDAARAALPALVAGLVADVSADPLTGAPLPVIAALDRRAFEAGDAARQALIEAFVAKRLLTAEGDHASERVRPVHEALLRIWPQAVAIVAEAGDLIRVRHALQPIVRGWERAPDDEKPRHLDISPALLSGAQQLVARFGADLPAAMRGFVAASSAAAEARETREREVQENRLRDAQALAAANRRAARRTGVGLAIAVLLAMLAGWQWLVAQAQRDRAERTLALATETANGLVFDLAQNFRDVVGVPAATIRAILDGARKLQDQLLGAGESSPALRRSQATALIETVYTLLPLGETQSALTAARQASEIFQALLAQQPDDADFQRGLSLADDGLGEALTKQGKLPEALDAYRASLAIREKLAKQAPGDSLRQSDLAWSLEKVGEALLAQGDLAGALQSYRARLAIMEQLATTEPGNAEWQHNLAGSYVGIGDVQVAQGRYPDALSSYQAGLAILDRVTKADPGNALRQRDLSTAYDKVGDMLVAQSDLPAALQSYRASLAIRERLAQSDPGDAGRQGDLVVPYQRIGIVLVAQGNLPEALSSYRPALAIIERLAASDPGDTGWQRALATMHEKIGDVLLAQGNLTEALKSYQASFAIRERLAKSDPANAGWQRDLSLSHAKLADAYRKAGDSPKAREALAAGRAIIAQLLSQHPDSPQWQQDLASFDAQIAALDK